MGIRIQRNSWHAPLQLIDSWLPHPPARPVTRTLSLVAQRFARAGWLWRGSALSDRASPSSPNPPASVQHRTGPAHQEPPSLVRISKPVASIDNRVVLSGRLSDVCAELERLAALEPGATSARH